MSSLTAVDEKRCTNCGIPKSLDEFHNKSDVADGKKTICKSCVFEYNHTPKARSNMRTASSKWAKKNPEKASAKSRRYYNRYDGASCKVKQAIADGILTRPDNCEECGCPCIPHGHHDDHDKPLEVRWLCPLCHKQADKEGE